MSRPGDQLHKDERTIAMRKRELERLDARERLQRDRRAATLRRLRAPFLALPSCPHGQDSIFDCPGCCENMDRHNEEAVEL